MPHYKQTNNILIVKEKSHYMPICMNSLYINLVMFRLARTCKEALNYVGNAVSLSVRLSRQNTTASSTDATRAVEPDMRYGTV